MLQYPNEQSTEIPEPSEQDVPIIKDIVAIGEKFWSKDIGERMLAYGALVDKFNKIFETQCSIWFYGEYLMLVAYGYPVGAYRNSFMTTLNILYQTYLQSKTRNSANSRVQNGEDVMDVLTSVTTSAMLESQRWSATIFKSAFPQKFDAAVNKGTILYITKVDDVEINVIDNTDTTLR